MTRDELVRFTAYLGEFISDHKKRLIEVKMDQRTRFITVVLEDIFNPHNASAVIRSCDCFGIQDLHVVEQRNEYRLNPGVSLGSSKWVDLFRYNKKGENNTLECLTKLKKSGYRIVGVTPQADSIPIKEFEINGPVALVFGTEMEGLSEEALEHADDYIRIPMKGFTESFNISVCAALCLYELGGRIEDSEFDWKISHGAKEKIRLNWYKKVVNKPEMLEKDFFNM